jgi:regulator of protease activity HflC (stomatin/prohibitin superfamily)
MNKVQVLFMVFILSILAIGCNEKVPPGYVGMVMQPAGLAGSVLQPGLHSCWGRDEMVLIETKEVAEKEPLSILCKDDLNFKFDLIVKTRLNSTDPSAIKDLLNRQGSNMESGVLSVSPLYNTYVRPAARSIARDIVSKYDTTQIRENREEITKAINISLKDALKGTPMALIAAFTSNFDYPDVITKAVERKRKKQIEIDEEKAKQAMKLLQAQNRKEIAEKEKQVRAAEAEAEAAYIAIVGRAITPEYLKRMDVLVKQEQVNANKTLYQKVGQGDKVIVTGTGSAIPIIGK